MPAHADPDDVNAQIDLVVGVPWLMIGFESSAAQSGGYLSTGPGPAQITERELISDPTRRLPIRRAWLSGLIRCALATQCPVLAAYGISAETRGLAARIAAVVPARRSVPGTVTGPAFEVVVTSSVRSDEPSNRYMILSGPEPLGAALSVTRSRIHAANLAASSR